MAAFDPFLPWRAAVRQPLQKGLARSRRFGWDLLNPSKLIIGQWRCLTGVHRSYWGLIKKCRVAHKVWCGAVALDGAPPDENFQ